MNFAIEARKLADFIGSLRLDTRNQFVGHDSYQHIGALYTNIVLQAGMNYKTVVRPRVNSVLANYPMANTVRGFLQVIQREGIEKVINWTHPAKIDRMYKLLNFSTERSINTCEDLSDYLLTESRRKSFLEIKGIGNKTLDYTLKLLNFDTVAVDRHIYSFIELAGLKVIDYHTTKKVVEFAADILEMSRASLDYSIWNYMSSKETKQALIDFDKPGIRGVASIAR